LANEEFLIVPLWKSLLLHLYYYGSRPYRWWALANAIAQHRVPVIVLFYHRVADDHGADFTTSNRAFRQQMLWLKDHFDLVPLAEAQRRIRSGDNTRPCVSITFDDGYADNCQEAIPLLVREKIPCTYFVTLHNVLTGQPFAHDLAHGHRFATNTLAEIRAMAAAGIEIGSHSYTHPDFGQTTDEHDLFYEVVTSGEELQQRLGRPVRYFAFPFGRYENLNARVFDLAHAVGYEGVCSAYGGYNFPGDDAFHLQRIPSDEELIRLKNRTTVDPRKLSIRRFLYETAGAEADRGQQAAGSR
jgi:peptidoglycan/xylan/chitin deacetylase (PgdA/CDA1 family)